MLNDFDRHIILYSKGWYQRADTLEDLRGIIGKISEVEPEYITKQDVWKTVVRCFLNYVSESNKIEALIRLFVPIGSCVFDDSADFNVTLDSFVSKLGVIHVKDILPDTLGEPDPEILPLYNSNKIKKDIFSFAASASFDSAR